MLDNKLFLNAIEQLRKERNIPVESMRDALEEAFVKTYRREFDPEADLRVDIDMKKGDLKLFHLRNIVETVEDELTEMSLKDAQAISKSYKIGEKHQTEVEFTQDFNALAALQVKQIIKQKVREKEKELVLTEYVERIGEIIEGSVETEKEHFFIIAFDRTFGFLNKLQVPKTMKLSPGDKVKAAIINIDKKSKGVPIILSMTSAEIVKRIIEKEIPEVVSGEIIIDKIARFAGFRTKLVVKSNAPGLDAIGTIIGENGTRIQRIISEVGREFIDVIPFIEDKADQISRAFVPAKPLFVKMTKNEDNEDKAIVVVSENDFSAAIGRGGSNAKVVSRLLDIEIKVMKDTEVDFDIPKQFSQPKTSYKRNNDIDMSKFIIENEETEDYLFDDAPAIDTKESEDNFAFEEVADIPEIDDFEGFADDQEDLLFDGDEDENTTPDNTDKFGKYYE